MNASEESDCFIPTILFDVDSVLAATAEYYCSCIREDFDTALYPEDCVEWDWDIPNSNLTFGEFIHQMNDEDATYLLDIDPITGARDAVNELYDAGWTVLIGTHRPKFTQSLTQEWLKEHGFRYTRFAEEIYHGVDKHIVQPDFIIDDYHENVTSAVTVGEVPVGVLVVCPWTSVPDNYEDINIRLVDSVADVPDMVRPLVLS
jgi:5'(3')-deoxyribonucleotidase